MPNWSWNDYQKQHGGSMKEEPTNEQPADNSSIQQLEKEIAELRRAVLILCNILVKEFNNRKDMDPILNLLRPHIRERAKKVMEEKRRKESGDPSSI